MNRCIFTGWVLVALMASLEAGALTIQLGEDQQDRRDRPYRRDDDNRRAKKRRYEKRHRHHNDSSREIRLPHIILPK